MNKPKTIFCDIDGTLCYYPYSSEMGNYDWSSAEDWEDNNEDGIYDLGELANTIRRKINPPKTVTFVIDTNLNYTNICKFFIASPE